MLLILSRNVMQGQGDVGSDDDRPLILDHPPYQPDTSSAPGDTVDLQGAPGRPFSELSISEQRTLLGSQPKEAES